MEASRRGGEAAALGRAAGGALIFALPMLMTMEMWWLGFTVPPLRLALLLAGSVPVMALLSYYSGFEETFRVGDNVRDAFVAFGVSFPVCAAALALFGAIGPGMPASEIVGKIVVQVVPAAIGATLARSQLGGGDDDPGEQSRRDTYHGEAFLAGTGALFLSFNVAPTEEMVLIAYRITPWHALGLALVSLGVMHAFVYAVQFRGQPGVEEGATSRGLFLRYTVVGYVIALAVSAYCLWTFGRFESTAFSEALMAIVVLGFPAAVGAAAARLIL